MRILLIRHGQSEANVNGRIQGPDDPLTELGREQARTLAPYLAESYTIDHLIASSLHRAQETARIIASQTGNDIVADARFREIDNGHSIGMLWSDWRAANPEMSAVWGWDVRHADAGWPGGECGRDVCNRSFAAFDEIITNYVDTDKTVAVVSHGGVIAWLAARLYGDSLETWPAAYGDIANCSVTEIVVNDVGQANIVAWNRTDYLGDTYAPHISPVIPGRGGNA